MYKILTIFQTVSDSEENRAVTVTQEAEIIGQSKVIDSMPVTFHKGRYKQQERALRLVEVGHKHIDYLEVIARNNYDARTDLNA